ncbi:MAG: ATP-binding cassette domain-containing protein [Pseudomonadota bacterium]
MQFGVKPLSENVSVKFSNGNCYGLIGANGCGKSTFMKILGKDLEPASGNISIDNHEQVGKLRQDQFAFEEYVVLDAAEFESEFAELDGYSAEARAAELLLGVGIPSSQHHGFMSAIAPGFKKSVRILSGGEQGRMLFGKLILQKPNILFMDESGRNLLNHSIARWGDTPAL